MPVARCPAAFVAGRGAHDEVGDDAAGAGVEVLADDAAVPDDVVLVDVDGLALLGLLDRALALGIVDVAVALAVVVDLGDAVLFVPRDEAAGAVDVALPAGLVAVEVIAEAPLADMRRGVRLGAFVGVVPVVAGALLRDRTAACDW